MPPSLKSAARRWLRSRRPEWARRGYAHLFNATILQADEGCDFDFMRSKGPSSSE